MLVFLVSEYVSRPK